MSETGLRSGEVADAAGVNVQTLRYYEPRGLLHEPDRSGGGHRLYPPSTSPSSLTLVTSDPNYPDTDHAEVGPVQAGRIPVIVPALPGPIHAVTAT